MTNGLERWDFLRRSGGELRSHIAKHLKSAEASDINTDAVAYGYKEADVYTILAAHCVME